MRLGPLIFSSRQGYVSRQAESPVLRRLTKSAVAESATITAPAITPNIDDPETILCIHNCQEHDGIGTLVIEIHGASVVGGLDLDVLPINGAYTVGKLPALVELLRDGLPVFGGGNGHVVIHQAIPNSSGDLCHNSRDSVVPHTVAESDAAVGEVPRYSK